MSSEPTHRFVINVDGEPRSLIGIKQYADNGKLRLFPNRTKFVRDHNSLRSHDVRKEQHYSLYPADDSPTGVSVFKHTSVTESVTFTKRHDTKAIKSDDGFAPLYFHRLNDLSLKAKKYKACETIAMGEYDPKHFTLFITVFVGGPDREFIWPAQDDFNVAQHAFRRFRVVVLWSFIGIRSNAREDLGHVETRDPEEVKSKTYKPYTRGKDEMWCVDFFRDRRQYFRAHYIGQIFEEGKEIPPFCIESTGSSTPFFRDGRTDTEEWKSFVRAMQAVDRRSRAV